ncbi:MAG: hypothetical protein ACI358_08315 [Candidatus Limimorpha sp.]
MGSGSKNNNDNFASGIWLIIIGVIALLVMFFDIDIVWSKLFELWPLILIILGVCIMPINRWVRVSIVTVLVVCGCLAYISKVDSCKYGYNLGVSSGEFDDDGCCSGVERHDGGGLYCQSFLEPYDREVRNAELKVEYGAGDIKMLGSCPNLVEATNNSDFFRQSMSVGYDGDKAKIKFSGEGETLKDINKSTNRFELALSHEPVWKFDFEVGACNAELDFSDYKVSDIGFESGACSVDMKIGTLCNMTKIEIETGVSEITIRVPKSAGCRIKSEAALSKKDFPGFEKIRDGVFETPGYAESEQTVIIELSCALSDVSVKRY